MQTIYSSMWVVYRNVERYADNIQYVWVVYRNVERYAQMIQIL